MSSRRDFKPRDNEKGRKRRSGPSLWVWLLTTILLAALVGGLIHLSRSSKRPVQPVANPQPPVVEPSAADEETPPPRPRFQFYDMLPNMEVTVPEPAGEEAAPTGKPTYYLQTASFKTHEQADAHKARLALLGLESSIQKMEIKGRTVYRVRLGPFHGRRKADVALRHLRDNGFDALLIKQP